MQISQSEYLRPDNKEIDEAALLQHIQVLAETGDFASIENQIATLNKGAYSPKI